MLDSICGEQFHTYIHYDFGPELVKFKGPIKLLLSVCQSVSLSVCQSVSLSVCQSVSYAFSQNWLISFFYFFCMKLGDHKMLKSESQTLSSNQIARFFKVEYLENGLTVFNNFLYDDKM